MVNFTAQIRSVQYIFLLLLRYTLKIIKYSKLMLHYITQITSIRHFMNAMNDTPFLAGNIAAYKWMPLRTLMSK